jgi:hypothetical protein
LSEIGALWQEGGKENARSVHRRNLLLAFVGLFGALSLARSVRVVESRSKKANLESWLHWFVTNYQGNGAALIRLGAIYLASHPQDRNRVRLSCLLAGDGTSPVPVSLIERIARDWSVHDVTVVEGWVMARTEARICALLHIMDGTTV